MQTYSHTYSHTDPNLEMLSHLKMVHVEATTVQQLRNLENKVNFLLESLDQLLATLFIIQLMNNMNEHYRFSPLQFFITVHLTLV